MKSSMARNLNTWAMMGEVNFLAGGIAVFTVFPFGSSFISGAGELPGSTGGLGGVGGTCVVCEDFAQV